MILGDSLSGEANQKFSTYDQDNDVWFSNCAEEYKGGWWYSSCYHANLNGLYLYGEESQPYDRGMVWNSFGGWSVSMRKSEMKLRPTGL